MSSSGGVSASGSSASILHLRSCAAATATSPSATLHQNCAPWPARAARVSVFRASAEQQNRSRAAPWWSRSVPKPPQWSRVRNCLVRTTLRQRLRALALDCEAVQGRSPCGDRSILHNALHDNALKSLIGSSMMVVLSLTKRAAPSCPPAPPAPPGAAHRRCSTIEPARHKSSSVGRTLCVG